MNAVDRKRFRAGLVIWGLATALCAYPELKAAWFKKRFDIPGWATPDWHTISHTIGDLEQENHWVALVVVSLIVVIAAYGIRLGPSAPTSPTGANRALNRDAGEAKQRQLISGTDPRVLALVYLAATAVLSIGGAFLLARSEPYDSFHVEYWMYGSLAVLLILIPLGIDWRWGRELPFTSLFDTVRIIENTIHVIAVVLLALLVILLIHLALYPWPDFDHFPKS